MFARKILSSSFISAPQLKCHLIGFKVNGFYSFYIVNSSFFLPLGLHISPSVYRPIKECLRTNISPGLTLGGLRYCGIEQLNKNDQTEQNRKAQKETEANRSHRAELNRTELRCVTSFKTTYLELCCGTLL